MTVTIPTSEAQYGYVVGRIIRVIGDTPSDPDDKPDALPAAGTVTFTPAAPLGIATGPSAFVLQVDAAQVVRLALKDALRAAEAPPHSQATPAPYGDG